MTTVLFIASASMVAANNRQQDDGNDSLYKYLSVFAEVFSLVNRAYVDELDAESLMSGAFEGAVDALDPFSIYIPPEKVTDYEATLAIGKSRSGITVLKERGVAYAVAVEEGSPAAKANIKAGNILSAIQGQRTRQTPLFEIHSILAGETGTEIEIESIAPRGQKETVIFELAPYDPPAVELEVRRGVGVLRLPVIEGVTPTSVESSLKTLLDDPDALPELSERDKLVVDLRGVAGGDASAAYQVAGLFASGELGALTARDEDLETFDGGESSLWQGGRIAVLLDRGTQGAAEVLAAILKQSADATLVGERSFGHSGRQRLLELSNGGRLQVTDAFFTGPDRQPLNTALEPDVPIRPTFSFDDGDEAGEGAEGAGAEGEAAAEGSNADGGNTEDGDAEGVNAEGGDSEDGEDEALPIDEVLERGLKLLIENEVIEEKVAA
ncbi:MAG: S41 family peptidase [Acidobacteriota bacterium]